MVMIYNEYNSYVDILCRYLAISQLEVSYQGQLIKFIKSESKVAQWYPAQTPWTILSM